MISLNKQSVPIFWRRSLWMSPNYALPKTFQLQNIIIFLWNFKFSKKNLTFQNFLSSLWLDYDWARRTSGRNDILVSSPLWDSLAYLQEWKNKWKTALLKARLRSKFDALKNGHINNRPKRYSCLESIVGILWHIYKRKNGHIIKGIWWNTLKRSFFRGFSSA